MGVGGQHHAPATLPQGKTPSTQVLTQPPVRRLGEPQGWPGRVQKILPPPRLDLWTVQPVASRYTNYTIQAHFITN